MGWVSLALIGVMAAAVLALLGVPRPLWSFAGAALMVGATGYAVQGSPALPGHPVTAGTAAIAVDPGLIALRARMFGDFTAENAFLLGSDAFMRGGDTQGGVDYVLAGLKLSPQSAMLWTGLGTAMAQHDGNTMSPAALFAFRRAITLAPRHPGPYFFLGIAQVRAGAFPQARGAWMRALALTPPGTSYRGEIVGRLVLLDRYLAAIAAAGAR
ncbi:MAG: hypothetical protein M3R41_07140 [Pseudomonadota bacterium]|nr:hypothetical protein [Pseudomonadota bacterium]